MISKELLKEVLLEQQRKIKQAKKEDFIIREKLNKVKKFIKIKHWCQKMWKVSISLTNNKQFL